MPKSMRAIVSVAQDWGIGRDGNLAVRNRADMKRFKELTWGATVVMGRKTLESLPGGRALPGRRNLVLTRDECFSRENVETAPGIKALKALLRDNEDVWVIGGESVYRGLLPLCDQCLVTMNQVTVPGIDAWFPNLDEHPAWRLAAREEGGVTEEGVPFAFLTYERRV